MNRFPMMVYAHPGTEKIGRDSFVTHIVESDDELAGALKNGFYHTPEEALKNTKVVAKPVATNQALAAEVSELQKQLEEGIAKLDSEREDLAKERAKVDAEAASTALAISNLEKDLAALAAEQRAVNEARESLDADRAAFEAQKVASQAGAKSIAKK